MLAVRPDPIKALVWAAIINGVTAAPAMCFIMLLASRRTVMGKLSLPAYIMALAAAVSSPSNFDRFRSRVFSKIFCDLVDSPPPAWGIFGRLTSVGSGAPRRKAFAVRTLENPESKLALASKKAFQLPSWHSEGASYRRENSLALGSLRGQGVVMSNYGLLL